MKQISCLVLSLLCVFFFACDETQQDVATVKADSLSLLPEADLGGHPIKFDPKGGFLKVYVTKREGAKGREEAIEDGRAITEYIYGAMLDVIELKGNYYGIQDRVTRAYTENGKQIEVSRWEKVYVLKSETGSADSIMLDRIELNSFVLVELEGNLTTETEREVNDGILQLELVTEGEFLDQRSKVKQMLIKDSTGVLKKGDEMKLPLKEGYKIFQSITNAEQLGLEDKSYTFMGVFPTIDQYVVAGSYYEHFDFRMVNKSSGEELILCDYPVLTADSKYLACIHLDPYGGGTTLEIYTCEGQIVHGLLKARFENWMPVVVGDDLNYFWGDHHTLYIKLNHWGKVWTKDGNMNPGGQYAKLTFKH